MKFVGSTFQGYKIQKLEKIEAKSNLSERDFFFILQKV